MPEAKQFASYGTWKQFGDALLLATIKKNAGKCAEYERDLFFSRRNPVAGTDLSSFPSARLETFTKHVHIECIQEFISA